MNGSKGNDSRVPLGAPADSEARPAGSASVPADASPAADGAVRSQHLEGKSLPPRKRRAGGLANDAVEVPEDAAVRVSHTTLVGGHGAPVALLAQAQADRGSHPSPPSWDEVERSLKGAATDDESVPGAITELDVPFSGGASAAAGAVAGDDPDAEIDAAIDAAIDEMLDAEGPRPQADQPAVADTPWPRDEPSPEPPPPVGATRYPAGTPLRTMTTLSSLAPVEGPRSAAEEHGSPLLGAVMVAAMAIVGIFGWYFTQDEFDRERRASAAMGVGRPAVAAAVPRPTSRTPKAVARPARVQAASQAPASVSTAQAAPTSLAAAHSSGKPSVPVAHAPATATEVPAAAHVAVPDRAAAARRSDRSHDPVARSQVKPPTSSEPKAGVERQLVAKTVPQARSKRAEKRSMKARRARARARAVAMRSEPTATVSDGAVSESVPPVLAIRPRLAVEAPEAPAPKAAEQARDVPSRQDVVKAMNRVRDLVSACRAGRAGVAEVELVVSGQGAVTHTVVRGDFAGSPEGSCIARAVRHAHFEPFKRPSVRLVYPFSL